MLVISRKARQLIRMTLESGEQIEILARRGREGKTVFSIEAPPTVRITRHDFDESGPAHATSIRQFLDERKETSAA